jgi:hypothetical protein
VFGRGAIARDVYREAIMAAQRAASVAIGQLSKAVDEAVQRAAEKAKVETEFSINGGLIWGRWLREAIDLGAAEKLASSITAHVQETVAGPAGAAAPGPSGGAKLQPAVLARNGHIICGFLPDPTWNIHA